MKTLLKLLVAVAFINAAVRGADAYWNYYQFKDAAERALLFGSSSSSQQLHSQLLQRAAELELPLTADDLSVSWNGNRRIVEAAYTQAVEFFPSYRYPIPFSFTVDNIVVGVPPRDDDYPPRR